MNRQEAIEVLKERIDAIEDDQAYSQMSKSMYKDGYRRMDAYRLAIKALSGPTPDPDTGLVPCGCGGKANIWPSDLRQAMVTAYQVGCIECAMTTVWVRGKQENAMKVWNTAMGWKGGAE